MDTFRYAGRNLLISHTAEIPASLRPGGDHSWMTQQAVDEFPALKAHGITHHTAFIGENLTAAVVENHARRPRWGIHAYHKARVPRPSPFLSIRKWPQVKHVTVELVASPRGPMLVRAYPGTYVPPLPWQVSADDVEGRREFCLDFWRAHSYLYRPGLVRGPLLATPPEWFTP